MASAKEPISLKSLQQIPTCYASCSIGSPSEPKPSLPEKLKAISAAGFQQIELSFPDLLGYASELCKSGDLGGTTKKGEIAEDDYESLCNAAKKVKELCSSLKLEILVLQPFGNFEGWAEGSSERKDAFKRLHGWIRIMTACGTDMLQVGSTDSFREKLSSRDSIVKDLQELADILAEKGYRVGYENWCWSSHAPKWKDVYEIMKDVDRPNFGLCLDTFQTAGSELADPTTDSGYLDNISPGTPQFEQLQKRFTASLEELSRVVPPEKIFFFQISDAYKPSPNPLPNKYDSEEGLQPRGKWSHYYRPLPFGMSINSGEAGYLPVAQVTKAILKTGYRGPFSIEIFDGGAHGGKEGDLEVGKSAKRAMDAHVQLLKECVDEK